MMKGHCEADADGQKLIYAENLEIILKTLQSEGPIVLA
jgi:hypothetical protein